MAPKNVVQPWNDGKKKPAVTGKRKADNSTTSSSDGGVVTRSSSTRGMLSVAAVNVQSDELPKSKKPKSIISSKGKVKRTEKLAAATADNLKSEEKALAERVKTVVIEHCKQCNSFKTRAIQVKNGLEKDLPGITVLINPQKPRRGCFEIREEGGDKFISLLDMKRPFAPMKALDMEKVVSDIVGKMV